MGQKVDTFPTIATVFPDTKLPLQTPGNGQAPAAKQVSLATIKTFILGDPMPSISTIGSTAIVLIPNGKLLKTILVKTPSDCTINVGSTAGASNYFADEEMLQNEWMVLSRPVYFETGGALHFSGMLAGSAIKIHYISL